MSTKFGVDSSSRFSFRARTDTHNQSQIDVTDHLHPAHASAIPTDGATSSDGFPAVVKLAFHGADTDTDILADKLARIVARMSACRSVCRRNNFRKSCVGRVGEDPREDVRVGVVEFQLYVSS